MCSRIKGKVATSGGESLCVRFADMAEEAQPQLLAVPVRGGLPFVEQRREALASRLQVRRRVDVEERVQRVLEALVAIVSEELVEALRDVVQAHELECN